MAKRLSDRTTFCLEQLAGSAITLPSVGKFGHADLVEPGLAVANENAQRRPRHGKPALLAFRDRRKDVVEPALLPGDLLGHIAYVNHALGINARTVMNRMNQNGDSAGRDRRRDARL